MKLCHPSAPKNLLVSRKTLLSNTETLDNTVSYFLQQDSAEMAAFSGRKGSCLYIHSGIQQKLPGVPT